MSVEWAPTAMNSVTIVSPHHDDAALSLGCLIARHARTMSVNVVNCYTRSRFSPFRRLSSTTEVSKARAREDRAFRKEVHGKYLRFIDLGEEDAPIRFHTSDLDWIARERPLDVTDLRHLYSLNRKLTQSVRGAVLLPTAVGHHIDHVMAFYAGLMLQRNLDALAFYLDVPYWLKVSIAELQRSVAFLEGLLGSKLFLYARTDVTDWDKRRLSAVYASQVEQEVANSIADAPFGGEVLVASSGWVAAAELACERVKWMDLRQ